MNFSIQGLPGLSGARNAATRAAVTVAALVLGACGGGSSTGTSGPDPLATCDPGDTGTVAECGSVIVSFTDADGDFLSYAVDVLSLELERRDGSVIEDGQLGRLVAAGDRVDTQEADGLGPAVRVGQHVTGGRLGRGDDLGLRHVVEAVGDVVAHRVVEQDHFLGDDPHVAPQVGQVEFAHEALESPEAVEAPATAGAPSREVTENDGGVAVEPDHRPGVPEEQAPVPAATEPSPEVPIASVEVGTGPDRPDPVVDVEPETPARPRQGHVVQLDIEGRSAHLPV